MVNWRPLWTAGLLVCAAQAVSGQEERWYCGRLEGEACLSAHEVIAPLGSATDTRFELELVVKAPRAVVFREAQRYVESALGRLREFRYETCEAGRVVTLRGSVRDQRVRALLVQDGVERRLSLELEPEAPLVGRVGERLQLLQLQAPGDSVEYSALELSSGALSLRVTKARLVALLPKGRRVVEVSSDGSPLRAVLDEEGDFHSLRYSIAGLCMQVVRCDGPVSLEGAVLPRTATVHAEGVPRFQERNAYELPLPLQRLAAEDAFQTLEGETLFVRSTSRPTAPDDLESSLGPSAGIEADAPELLAWLEGLEGVQGARSFSSRLASLRDGVRSEVVLEEWRVALGSALETLRGGRGDCTELANLMCATLRAAGVPARVELGMVYLTTRQRWALHAWNSAYDVESGRWVHVDGVYPSLPRSLYIAVKGQAGSRSAITALVEACGEAPVTCVTEASSQPGGRRRALNGAAPEGRE